MENPLKMSMRKEKLIKTNFPNYHLPMKNAVLKVLVSIFVEMTMYSIVLELMKKKNKMLCTQIGYPCVTEP